MKIHAFDFWECHRIGINIEDDGKPLLMYDLSIEDAKNLVVQLNSAIESFEKIETEYIKYTEDKDELP